MDQIRPNIKYHHCFYISFQLKRRWLAQIFESLLYEIVKTEIEKSKWIIINNEKF